MHASGQKTSIQYYLSKRLKYAQKEKIGQNIGFVRLKKEDSLKLSRGRCVVYETTVAPSPSR
jgi:hypothetical protein